jgi:hypothetical protein
MAFTTKYTRKKANKATYKSKYTEDVGNFYVKKPTMGDSPEKQYQRRRGYYGKKAPQDEGQLPLPFTGMIQF